MFKLELFSCMIRRVLLYESSNFIPCAHQFCKICISCLKDCPLGGAGIDKIELDPDPDPGQFIEDEFRERICLLS